MNADPILTPVLVNLRESDGVVSIRELRPQDGALALVDGEGYWRLGQVEHAKWQEQNPRTRAMVTRRGFGWWRDDKIPWGVRKGTELTRKAAIAAMLRAAGYVEAPENSTMEGLFDV